MKLKKNIIYVVFIGLLSANFSFAASDGGLPGYFLNQNVGVRALGMGGSYVSLSDDISAIYWNPAGLNFLQQNEISFMHNILFESTRCDFVGLGFPSLNSINVGVGFVQLY